MKKITRISVAVMMLIVLLAGTVLGVEAASTYKVKFDANGGSGTMSAQTITRNKSTALKANAFTRKGYTFQGWATSADGAVVYANKASVKNLASAGGTKKLYAVWKANTFTVHYDANGGTGTMADDKFTYGVSKSTTPCAFTRKGYTFGGWYVHRASDDEWGYSANNGADSSTKFYTKGKQPDGWGLHPYSNGGTIAKTSSVKGDVCTFYAVWIPNEYTVRYDANGGTGTMKDTVVTYGENTPLREPAFTKTGYSMVGWNRYRTSDNKWYYTSADKSTSAWYVEGTEPEGYTKNVMKTTSGVSKTSPVDGDIVVVYAVWEANTYTVTFNANGGSGKMTDVTMTYDVAASLTANAFTRTGYVFKGWATTANGAVAYADAASVKNLTASGNVTLYAVWEAVGYFVSFDANGGSGTMEDQMILVDTVTALTANSCTLKGHKFAGWATSADGDVVYADKASVTLTADITLYAVWTPNQYILRYDANGGDGTMEDTIVTYGVSTALSEPTFTMKGHHVSGWYRYRSNDNKWYYTSADGSTSAWYVEGTEPEGYTKNVINTTSSVSKTSPVDGDIVIVYAVWEVNTFTVRYDANGGDGTMSDDTFTWGVSKNTTKSKFTREGFTFGGWYVERQSDGKWAYSADNGADGSTKFYTKGSQPEGWGLHAYSNGGTIAKTSSVDGDVCIFHAIWEKVSTEGVSIDGKKAIFIGNSFVYYGGVVETGSQKKTDKGWFYQICQANGENCTVYDCTYGSHHLYDFTSSGCESGSCHDGADLLSGISFSSIDYVFFSESGDNNSNFLKDAKAVMKRFTASKTKFYYLAHSYTYSKNHTNIINKLSSLQDLGVNIVVWGKLVDDVIDGRTTVSGATVTYKKNTFIKNDGDTYHPNPLAGYITAQMCYCAVTGKTAVGQMPDVYAIGDTIKYGKSKVGYSAYISTHYTSSSASNFKTVMKSSADIKGLQKLMDKYLAKWGLGVDG